MFYLVNNCLCLVGYTETLDRARDKREYSMIIEGQFSYLTSKLYVLAPHLNRLIETVQMRGYNIWFQREIRQIIPELHQILILHRALM